MYQHKSKKDRKQGTIKCGSNKCLMEAWALIIYKLDFVESLRVLVVKNPGIPQRWLDIRESFDDNFLATIWNVGSFVFWTQLFGGPRDFLLCPGNN